VRSLAGTQPGSRSYEIPLIGGDGFILAYQNANAPEQPRAAAEADR